MGRRKKYPKSALVRLTADEHALLVARAKKARLSLSRFLVQAGLTGKAPTHEDREQHERAIIEVKRLGNNLNQIARQLNAHRGTIHLGRLEQVLVEAKTAVDAVRGLRRRS